MTNELLQTGKMTIRKGRKIAAEVFYRPVFFAKTRVKYSYNFSLCIHFGTWRGTAEFDTFEEVLHALEIEGITMKEAIS